MVWANFSIYSAVWNIIPSRYVHLEHKFKTTFSYLEEGGLCIWRIRYPKIHSRSNDILNISISIPNRANILPNIYNGSLGLPFYSGLLAYNFCYYIFMIHKLWNLLCKLNKELLVLHSYLTDSIARRLLSEDECPETKSTFQQNENLSLLNKIIYGHNFWPIYFESRLFRMNILRTSRQLQSLRTYQSIAGKSLGEFKARFWIYRGLLGRCIILETIQNFNKPMESKTDVPGITITYFQPKTNITVNRENIYMGAKRTNDIPNYGAQVEFIIKDLVWLVFILIVVI